MDCSALAFFALPSLWRSPAPPPVKAARIFLDYPIRDYLTPMDAGPDAGMRTR